jgi:hypothetical protein
MWRPCWSLVEAVARGGGKIPPLAVGYGRFANGGTRRRWASTVATDDIALSVMARQVEMLSDKIKQLYSEKDAEIKQLHSEKALKDTEILKLSLILESVRSSKRVALIRAGRVDLRGILEHLLKEEGTGTSEAQIVAFVGSQELVVERCRQEPKITSDVSAVTAAVLGQKLHRIWRRLCSDVHPRLTPDQWRLTSGEDCIQLRSNGESDSDVLLLYHLFDHFGYPVQSADVVLRQQP